MSLEGRRHTANMKFIQVFLWVSTVLSAPAPKQQDVNAGKVVDLGYARYQGYTNSSTGLTSWLGIRYAASAEGKNRWQPPQPPPLNRAKIMQANKRPPTCPQATFAPYKPNFDYAGSEDCLFLNVIAPTSGATGLPVLFSIHGGGYGLGSASLDPAEIMNANGNGFVTVVIQYRLGAFGFLSSAEVKKNGTPNAGILDQHYALQWVQKHIHLFGGDPKKVTIQGESAGGGSVMLQAMAYGGTLGTSLFQNGIAASPYLPMQYQYDGLMPSKSYATFVKAAGCSGADDSFACLVGKDSNTLQNASSYASASGFYGTWGFLPVTDGNIIRQRPSQQLQTSNVNGKNILSGVSKAHYKISTLTSQNNANEAPLFVPNNIATEQDLKSYIRNLFPKFTDQDVSKVLTAYPFRESSGQSARFATTGTSPPTALTESSFATGQQQRAYNIYAETTFVCPSHWLAEAFGRVGGSYKYQFSVPLSQHGADVAGYFGPRPNYLSEDFEKAFMTIYGNFIKKSNPSIASSIAEPGSSHANPISNWPSYSVDHPMQINLNETGGVVYQAPSPFNPALTISLVKGPGLKNDISLHNAYTWEGGRGKRCDFWRQIGADVPE